MRTLAGQITTAEKYKLSNDIGAAKAGPMIQKYGQKFVDLSTQDREALTAALKSGKVNSRKRL